VREIDASDGRLTAEVRGEVETSDDGVLIIRRIHVSHRIAAAEEKRGTVERVHAIYAQKCPVYRSLQAAIEITSSYELIAT
jgi:uncharacterized OsmC-like protein